MPTIGTRILQRRLELGLSQEELARRVGYKDRSSIAKIETGARDIRQTKVIEFAKALNTTPEWLMGWSKSTIIIDRAAALCKEKGTTLEQMSSDLHIDLKVLNEFDKTALETHVNPISETAIECLHSIALFLESTMTFLLGQSDDREQSRLLSKQEFVGKIKLLEINPKDERLREIVARIDELPDSDRSILLDQIENLLKFYYQTLVNNQNNDSK